MRWSPLLLTLFAAAFLFACGGNEYSDQPVNTGETPEAGAPAKAPDQAPPKQEVQRASPMAAKLAQERKMCDAVKDDNTKAKKALERAEYYATQSVTGDALFYFAELWRMAREYAKAADTYKQFMSQCPSDKNCWTASYYTATCLVKAERAAEAVAEVNSFQSKFPDKKKYLKSMAGTVGYGLLAQGDFAGSTKMLGLAAELGDSYAGEEMVRCLWAQGDYDQARTKANDLKAQFNGSSEQERYDSVAALAEKMGAPALKIEPEGWSRDVDIESLQGKAYLVYFWSMKNLGTAKGTETRLRKLYDRYAGEGIEFIGLSKHSQYDLVKGAADPSMGTEEELQQLKTWADPNNFGTPWWLGLCGDDKFHDYYGYRGKVPAIALVGKKGNLRYFRDSKDDEGYAIVAKVIEKLLDE